MEKKGIFTGNPLGFIQRCVRSGKIFWTYHVNMRIMQRGIFRKALIRSVDTFQIIEDYPMDKYFPSYLVFARDRGDILHILFAIDAEEDNIRVITAYRPKRDEWSADFKTRRAKK
ncbi:MAG: DUF4258 domain-containing protein [Thermodesulfobacteriota bacterium]